MNRSELTAWILVFTLGLFLIFMSGFTSYASLKEQHTLDRIQALRAKVDELSFQAQMNEWRSKMNEQQLKHHERRLRALRRQLNNLRWAR